jgi:hypothetical protein
MTTLRFLIVPTVLAVIATAGCGTVIENRFGRTVREDIEREEGDADPGEGAPVVESCWGVSGTIDMAEGSVAPVNSGIASVYLFEAQDVDDRGFQTPGAEPIDTQGGEPAELPWTFQLCYDDGLGGSEAMIIAFLDVDDDGDICDDGDFVVRERIIVDETASEWVEMSFLSVIYDVDCGGEGGLPE